MTQRSLGEIAHSRAGDKGDTSILMVAPFDPADYERVCRALTPHRIAVHFGTDEGRIGIHPSPRLAALTIVLRTQLSGGVTRATTLDPHGKSLSGHLLQLPLDDEAASVS